MTQARRAELAIVDVRSTIDLESVVMGQDAVALVRIPRLRLPKGSSLTVVRLTDCALIFTFDRFDHFSADEHAVRLRDELGARLAPHDDKRGILFFSDICEPSGKTYAAIVRELGSAGHWGLASKVSSKRAPRVDRVLRETANQRGLDREWFVRRSRKKASREERAELEDFVLEIVNTLIDDGGGGGDENIARDLVEARVAAWVANEPPLFKASSRTRKAPVLTKPGEPGYDPDVAEMIRLFGGDERSWRETLNPHTAPEAQSVAAATRPTKKRSP